MNFFSYFIRATTMVLLFAACGLVTSAAMAHTLFIVEETAADVGTPVVSVVHNGSVVETETRIQSQFVAQSLVVGPEGSRDVTLDTSAEVARMSFTPQSEGTYLLAAATRPRKALQSAEGFAKYMRNEGLIDAQAEREALQENDKMAIERYTKWAKALVFVGNKPTGGYDQVLGHAAEIVPVSNPAALQAGDVFTARLYLDGELQVNKLVYGARAGDASELMTRTDGNGQFEFTLDRSGIWYFRHISLTRTGDYEYWYSPVMAWLGAQEERIPYRSEWATLTFNLR